MIKLIKNSLYIAVSILLFTNCSGEEKPDPIKIEDAQAGTIQSIETLFDQDVFENPKMADLLKELNMCAESTSDTLDYLRPTCSPRFFRFFELDKNLSIENGFLLQVKSKVSGFPLRRLLVFVREGGQLVKVNGFVANLIGRRKTSGAYDDLLLRFNDNVDGEATFYNCFFSWNGTKYAFKSVEVIEGANWGGPVKAEFKDSMSLEIQQVLSTNKMLF